MHQLIHYNMGSKSAIGIGNGICFKQVRDKGGGSYIDPLVRDSIVGLWKSDQNTNESPTRNIIKNTIKDKGGDLELLNFGYKLNSGYGKYEVDFTTWIRDSLIDVVNVTNELFYITNNTDVKRFALSYNLTPGDSDLKGYKVKVEIIKGTGGEYKYYNDKGNIKFFTLNENKIYTLPTSHNSILTTAEFNAFLINPNSSLRVTQIPSYQGALVTDGKDDLIISTKTVKEMLGGSNEVTVVSMMANLDSRQILCNSNFSNTDGYNVRNTLEPNGVISMLGYTDKNGTTNNLNLIMGDKNSIKLVDKVNFNSDYVFHVSSYNTYSFKTAWYWTIIANKVLTTDQINQVISYFNLDKHVKPDVYYNVKKQGLSNDTPEADWYLKNFSGNGYDMQLYNFVKKLGSGIGKYEADYSTWTKTAGVISTPFGLKITEPTHNYWILYTSNITVPAHKVKISGIPEGGEFRYLEVHILKNGINELPKMEKHPSAIGFTLHRGTTQPSDWVGLSVEQIPDCEGALVSDAIDDYGKVENLPIYKDYTVVADREMLGIADGGVFLKGESFREGAFSFDYTNESSSFGGSVQKLVDTKRLISYQSKYVNNGINIKAGTATDTDKLWLAKLGNSNKCSRLALWSFLLFPYTLSEFLIERQLKRYKLGTLHPGMIEWRPKVNINVPVVTPPTFSMNNGSDIITNGQYIPEGTEITIRIFTTTDSSVGGINEATAKINGVDIELSPSGNKTYYGGKFIVSSKQKIDITIDEYIRYEDIV